MPLQGSLSIERMCQLAGVYIRRWDIGRSFR